MNIEGMRKYVASKTIPDWAMRMLGVNREKPVDARAEIIFSAIKSKGLVFILATYAIVKGHDTGAWQLAALGFRLRKMLENAKGA